jgi:hypothetical protein
MVVTPGHASVATASVATSTNTGIAYFSPDEGSVEELTALAENAVGCQSPPPDGYEFPHGLFSFKVRGIGQGGTVRVTITLPSAMDAGTTKWWKCINGQWVDCTSCLSSDDGDNVLVLTLVDDGPCDTDPTPGTIADPGGPAAPAAAAPGVAAGHGSSWKPPLPLNEAQFSLQYLSINPGQTTAGQPVTITTNVVNTGDEAGNYNVALKINGQVEEAKMVSVGPHGTQPVKFTVTKDQPGTYNVDILDKAGSFVITGAGGTTGSSTGGFIVLALIGVLVIATIVVLLIRRS